MGFFELYKSHRFFLFKYFLHFFGGLQTMENKVMIGKCWKITLSTIYTMSSIVDGL